MTKTSRLLSGLMRHNKITKEKWSRWLEVGRDDGVFAASQSRITFAATIQTTNSPRCDTAVPIRSPNVHPNHEYKGFDYILEQNPAKVHSMSARFLRWLLPLFDCRTKRKTLFLSLASFANWAIITLIRLVLYVANIVCQNYQKQCHRSNQAIIWVSEDS